MNKLNNELHNVYYEFFFFQLKNIIKVELKPQGTIVWLIWVYYQWNLNYILFSFVFPHCVSYQVVSCVMVINQK